MHTIAHSRATPATLVRAGWGALLLCAPAPLLRLTGTPATHLSRGAARVLAARHLAQAVALMAVHPRSRFRPRLMRAVALTDAAHATSGVTLAATGHAPRAWLPDAVIATSFAASTWRDRPPTR